MILGLFYVLLSTSTKIFARKNFRESVQTREKRENLHPAKLTGYTVRSVAICYRLLARTYSESAWCNASCSVVVSLFAACYYTSILAKLHLTL